MSPETDPNLQPSAIDAAPAQAAGEEVTAASIPMSASPQDGGGAATGAAPARERTPIVDAAEETDSSEAVAEAPEAAPIAAEPAAAAEPEQPETLETMDQLMDQFSAPEPVAAEGEIFDGRVLAVTEAGVVVDVGGKFEGLVPAQEFLDSGAPIEFGAGQTIEVERLHEQKDGYVLLSHVRAHRRRVWERIEKSYREHTNVNGKIAGADQGRAGGRYRRAGVSAGVADRAEAGARSRGMERPRDRSARPEVEPQTRQRGGEPARNSGRRAEGQAGRARVDAFRRRGRERAREERDGLRSVRRSRRDGWAAARKRFGVGPRAASLVDREARRRDSGANPEIRQGKAAHFARTEATAARSLGDGAGAVPGGNARCREKSWA